MTKYIVVIMLFIFSACNDNHDTIEELEGHSHADIKLQTTLLNNHLEFFIEYSPLIINQSSEFLIHISNLKDYSPIKTGVASLTLGNRTKLTKAPIRDGVFKLSFKPKQSGKFKISYKLQVEDRIEIVSDSIVVLQNEEQIHDLESDEIPGIINYTKEQAWKNDFAVKLVEKELFSSTITTSGEMLAMPGEKQNVAAKSTGIILFASKKMVQGSRVKKGQLLFTVSGQDISNDNIGVQFSEAKNKYLKSKSEYFRHKELFMDKIVSEKQFIESQTQYKSDSVSYFILAASVSEKGQRIYAPISGYIHELNISEGEYIETGHLLATISTNSTMLLRADLPQQYFRQLNSIVSGNFRPAYSPKTYKMEDLNGQIIAKGASVAENNHFMPVYFKVQNDGSLLEGAFAEFYLITRNAEYSIAIPNSAIIEEQGNYYVYVQKQGESYLKTPIDIKETDGINSSVSNGLNEGDIIVSKGAMLIKIASASASMPAHNHSH